MDAIARAWRHLRAWRACAARIQTAYDDLAPQWLAQGYVEATPECRRLAAEERRLARRRDSARAHLVQAERNVLAAVETWQEGREVAR